MLRIHSGDSVHFICEDHVTHISVWEGNIRIYVIGGEDISIAGSETDAAKLAQRINVEKMRK